MSTSEQHALWAKNNVEHLALYRRTRYAKNKELYQLKQRSYWYDNPEKKKLYRENRYKKFMPLFRQLINDLKHRPCKDCNGWFEPCQMEFDHRNPADKKYEVGNMKGNSIKTILTEVSKCDIVCSNCHRLRTWKQQTRSKYI